MPFPATIANTRDLNQGPSNFVTYSGSNAWVASLVPEIHVYGGNWYKIQMGLPRNQGLGGTPSAIGDGQYYLSAWKSTDLGLTWAIVDPTNGPRVYTLLTPFQYSVQRVSNTLHTLYIYGLVNTPAAPDTRSLGIKGFDLATETWGTGFLGGPTNAYQAEERFFPALAAGIPLQLLANPDGTGFIVFYISDGYNNATFDRHTGPYISSYITVTFGGVWGSQVDFPVLETYGGIPTGLIAAPSGRVHFFFQTLLHDDGTYPGTKLYECSLFSGVISAYHQVTDTVWPLGPAQLEATSFVGNPAINGTEIMIPYIGVWNTGASTPFDPQNNTKVFVAHFTSSAAPTFALKAVTTAANQGPNAGYYNSNLSFDQQQPCVTVNGTQIAVGWMRSINTDNGVTRATDPTEYYYSQYNGSAWTTPTLAYTSAVNSYTQWCQFTAVDSTTVAWVYQPLFLAGAPFTVEIYVATVSAPPVGFSVSCGNPPDGTVGVPYDSLVPHTGGTGVVTFTIDSGSLPPGLLLLTHLSPSNYGSITGTPTLAGTYTFVIKATDFLANEVLTGTCSITIVDAGSPTISCNNPPAGYVDIAYDHFFTATGGTPPYTFSIVGGFGTLPPGLSLATTGEVTGTPTTAGSYTFRVRVTDSLTATDDIDCTINIIAAPVVNCNNPPNGVVGVAYSHLFSVTGGVAPFTFALIAGGVPGLAIDGLGALSGIPTTAGTFGFTIRVTDAVGRTSTVVCSITIVVAPPLALACNNPPNGTINVPYSHQLTISGGVGPYVVGILTGAFPPGLNISATGLISGLPTAAGLYVFTLRVTDSQPIPFAAELTCSILIEMGHATCPDLDNPQIPGTIVPIDAATELYLRRMINDLAGATPPDQNS